MADSGTKAAKAGLAYTVGNVLLKGIAFLTLPIFSRILTTEEFGFYNLYVSYETILTIFVGLCLYGSLRTAKYDYRQEFDSYVSSTLMLSGIVYIAVMVIGNLVYPAISGSFGFDRSILNILITHSYAMFIFQFYNTWLALDFKYKKFLVVSGINSIGGTLLSIFLILVVFKEHKYIGRIYGYAIVPICVAAVIWLCFFRDAKKTKQVLFNTNYWKYGLSISLPLVIHTFSQQILSQFDRIMIGALVSVVAVGIYGFIQTIASILQIIVQSMDNAWSVWMYEQLDQKQYTQIQDKSKAYILLMNILYVGFISLAPDVIHIAGTKEYYDGISMVIPLSFAIYFIFLYSLPVHIEYFYKKTKFIATGTSLAAGINIALNYFFIRSYGYTASAWTTLASYFLLFVFHWFIAKKIDGNPMFPKKTIIGSIIALSTFSAWTILIINHMLIRWISMLLFFVLSLICNSKTILPLTDKLASKLKNG